MEGERSATGAKRAAEEAGLGTPEAPEARRARQEGDIGAQFRLGAESSLVGQNPAPADAETSPQGSEQGQSATFVPLSAVTGGALDRVGTPLSGALSPSETVVPETAGEPADGADGHVEGGGGSLKLQAEGARSTVTLTQTLVSSPLLMATTPRLTMRRGWQRMGEQHPHLLRAQTESKARLCGQTSCWGPTSVGRA